MSEDLTDYLLGIGVRVKYMHSEVDSLDRVDILRGLRLGILMYLSGESAERRSGFT